MRSLQALCSHGEVSISLILDSGSTMDVSVSVVTIDVLVFYGDSRAPDDALTKNLLVTDAVKCENGHGTFTDNCPISAVWNVSKT